MFSDKFRMVVGLIIALAIISFISFSSGRAASQPLTITRGGTGIDSLCEGCFLVGESIDRASSTNAITVDMTTGALQIGEISISSASEGDMVVDGSLGVGTTSPQDIFHVFGQGTTTVQFGDHTSSTARTCFNINRADGTDASFYFVGTAIVVEATPCL